MSYDCTTADDVLKIIKDEAIEMVDLRFTDIPGLWQHFSVPPRALDADSFADGVGFDGSSIRGFQEIQESDMLVLADPTTAFRDPFTEAPTLVLICNISDPITGQPYSRDPRFIARKAETHLRSTRIGDNAYFGPELEHFVFNEVHYDQSTNYGYYEIDAVEANWKAKGGTGLGHKLRPKEGYFPVPPADTLQDARTSMVTLLERIGVAVEAHHHEVATGGQGEIDMRFAALTRMADNVMIYKYVVKNVARQRGMTATFMPKPLFGDNGSGSPPIRKRNHGLPICRKRQIPLAFMPTKSNGRDVLGGAQAPEEQTRRSVDFLGPARLAAGPGLAVVTATAPFEPRG